MHALTDLHLADVACTRDWLQHKGTPIHRLRIVGRHCEERRVVLHRGVLGHIPVGHPVPAEMIAQLNHNANELSPWGEGFRGGVCVCVRACVRACVCVCEIPVDKMCFSEHEAMWLQRGGGGGGG